MLHKRWFIGMNNYDLTSLTAAETKPVTSEVGVRAGGPLAGTITSINGLRHHLQWAIELEHATIPPYLCALYSIEPGRNLEAVEVISSVVIEEMLHLTLAANLMNAVGGEPRVDVPQMLPGYPRPLPHSDRSFQVSLVPFGPEAIETLLKIEQPSRPSSPPEADNYETIGQFYGAMERGLRELSSTIGEKSLFCGDPARQVTDEHAASASGTKAAHLHGANRRGSHRRRPMRAGCGQPHQQEGRQRSSDCCRAHPFSRASPPNSNNSRVEAQGGRAVGELLKPPLKMVRVGVFYKRNSKRQTKLFPPLKSIGLSFL